MPLLEKLPKFFICLKITIWAMQNNSERKQKETCDLPRWLQVKAFLAAKHSSRFFTLPWAAPDTTMTFLHLCSSVNGFVWPQSNPDLWGKQSACASSLSWLTAWSDTPRYLLCGTGHGLNEVFLPSRLRNTMCNSTLKQAKERDRKIAWELLKSFPRG